MLLKAWSQEPPDENGMSFREERGGSHDIVTAIPTGTKVRDTEGTLDLSPRQPSPVLSPPIYPGAMPLGQCSPGAGRMNKAALKQPKSTAGK